MQRKERSPSSHDLIYETIRQIPRGKVSTYGGIAKLSGLPGHARLVGYALHSTPHDINIPWHRVINAQGRISLPKNDGAYSRQKKLLIKEGITFRGEKIDLTKYGWPC
jgi:methylated-DNA-protein-cysteine methyltransferase-like protein